MRHAMSLAAGTRLGAYEIAALIGTGGMGGVYRVRDTRLGRHAAQPAGESMSRRASSRNASASPIIRAVSSIVNTAPVA